VGVPAAITPGGGRGGGRPLREAAARRSRHRLQGCLLAVHFVARMYPASSLVRIAPAAAHDVSHVQHTPYPPTAERLSLPCELTIRNFFDDHRMAELAEGLELPDALADRLPGGKKLQVTGCWAACGAQRVPRQARETPRPVLAAPRQAKLKKALSGKPGDKHVPHPEVLGEAGPGREGWGAGACVDGRAGISRRHLPTACHHHCEPHSRPAPKPLLLATAGKDPWLPGGLSPEQVRRGRGGGQAPWEVPHDTGQCRGSWLRRSAEWRGVRRAAVAAQMELRAEARALCQEHVLPFAAAWDRQRVRPPRPVGLA
jgi:hypothetical protein